MKRSSDTPLLIGHRGAPQHEPENTLAGFRHALEAGLDGIELDVQQTQDGVLVVHHDPTLATGERLDELTWEELHTTAPQVPRLEAVLELLDAYPDRYLNIEVKSRFPKDDGRTTRLASCLDAWQGPAKAKTWISSFDPLVLVRLIQTSPLLPLAFLASSPEALELLAALPGVGVHARSDLVTPSRMSRWHDEGRFVYSWTVNEFALARRLLSWGVDGLIGDHPELLMQARRRTRA
jgi:glycerophosphoryl diester phosphodiesterase